MNKQPRLGRIIALSLMGLMSMAGARGYAAAAAPYTYLDDSPTGPSLRAELLEDSKGLAAVLNECNKHSGRLVGQSVGELQKRLGKEMIPRDSTDITMMLRIVDDCTAYLSSPELVTGMELPAAQEKRREANGTLRRLDEITSKLTGAGLRSLEARTREHLNSPTAAQSASVRLPSRAENTSNGTLAMYERPSNAPDLPGRISPAQVQAILAEVSEEGARDTSMLLSVASSTVSADMLALQSATMRYPNFASHPLMQSISSLQRQLGKRLQPKTPADVEAITGLLSRTLRIFGGSEFGPAYRHVDEESKALAAYKARQSAMNSAGRTIADIETTLDQGKLVAANEIYQQVVNDPFMSRFSPAQHYLSETAVLRKELSAYSEATQVPRVNPSQPAVTQVLVFANESAKAEASNQIVLARELLSRSVAADKEVVMSRLESLAPFQYDPRLYKTQPITSENVARDMTRRLDELTGKLRSASELNALLGNQDAMQKARLLFGDALEADLRRKGTSIPAAQQMAANLTSAIQTHQRQVEEAEERRRAAIEEQNALAGKIVNGALLVVMLEEKFQRTSIMGYQMEASKQRQQLRSLLQRDRSLLTPQVWRAVQSEFERLMPGLTVYQASATQSLLANLRRTSN